jgi:2-iminobutanoate/2-iminopropanoate deaminase
MTRRKFIKGTGATAVGTAVVTKAASGATPAAGGRQTKAKSSRKIVTTERAPRPVGPYSQAVVAGNTIYVAGQGPFDPGTRKIVEGGFEQHAVQTFENVKAIVEAAGATLGDVVKVNVYLTDLANFTKMNEIYTRYFKSDFPVRTTVGTQLLGGMLIEVDCIAAV